MYNQGELIASVHRPLMVADVSVFSAQVATTLTAVAAVGTLLLVASASFRLTSPNIPLNDDGGRFGYMDGGGPVGGPL